MPISINKEKRALLYGGGIDSYCTYHLMKSQGIEFDTIRFDLGTRYESSEHEAILNDQDVTITHFAQMNLNELEHDDAHLPYRNLMMASFAASMGYQYIALGGTMDDRSSDMTDEGFQSMSQVLTDLEKKSVVVYAPYGTLTKKQLVDSFLELGAPKDQFVNLLTTFSCYRPLTAHEPHCMCCKACLRRWIYLMYACGKVGGSFATIPRFALLNMLKNEYRRVVVKGNDVTDDRRYVTQVTIEGSLALEDIRAASKMTTYVVDLDGTLCVEQLPYSPEYYPNAVPKRDVIDTVNDLFDQGHEIIIYTSRYEEDRGITVQWLSEHGVKYDDLLMGKPKYDYWIDDRSILLKEFAGKER